MVYNMSNIGCINGICGMAGMRSDTSGYCKFPSMANTNGIILNNCMPNINMHGKFDK